jgi:hypothetical protein
MSIPFSEMKGMSMKLRHNRNRIDTTLGELIATISDVAFENSASAKEAYDLTSLVLGEILKGASFRSEIINQPFFWH